METLIQTHASIYHVQPKEIIFVPGRVNLIGEHTDYSGGYVMPIAIENGIYAAISKRRDSIVEVYSVQYSHLGIQTVKKPYRYDSKKQYLNYIEGVHSILEDKGYDLNQGLSITLYSTLPTGAGLSSSAALEILIAQILKRYNDLTIDDLEIVYAAQAVENKYLKLSSGILDQYAIMFGKKNHALMLHTRTMNQTMIPINLDRYTLVLMNTNKQRTLTESAYNDRYHAIIEGMKYFDAPLDQITLSQYEKVKAQITDPIISQRVKHVVSENARVLDAFVALKSHDYKSFGTLMFASHESLKNDYDVSCPELDYLVAAHKQYGALGARMTGAGFGGTMIALYEGTPPSFDALKKDYKTRFNLPLEVMTTKAVNGPSMKGETV